MYPEIQFRNKKILVTTKNIYYIFVLLLVITLLLSKWNKYLNNLN